MENISHPSAFIETDDVAAIRDTAALAEQAGMLHNEQLKVIYKKKWFKLLVPKLYSGLQISLPDLVRLQEAISWADGSTGWVVTLCTGAGWFGGFINAETARQVLNDPKTCLAGSGATSGTAEITASGYLVNGTWRYASGIHHATHITANCIIKKDGENVLDQNGKPMVLPFIFDKKDVKIVPHWKHTGMVATGSDSFEIKDVEVSFNRQFKIDGPAAVINDPLYRYPFLQLAYATLAVNLSGIAVHFMDLCGDVFEEKRKQPRLTDEQKVILTDKLSTLKAAINRQRKSFFDAVDQSWIAIQYADNIPDALLNKVSVNSVKLAHLAVESVDKLYPLCGLVAACSNTEINRAWRDLHTASQHALLTFPVNSI